MIKTFFVELIYRFLWPLISNWVQRSEKRKVRDAQADNDARDRGSAGDIAARLRNRSQRERDAGRSVPPPDDER